MPYCSSRARARAEAEASEVVYPAPPTLPTAERRGATTGRREEQENLMSSKKRSLASFDNGKHKRRSSKHEESEKDSKPVDTVYRILCPVKKIGSVLGKGGSIINALRKETHAKIRVADAIPGAEERVIIIYSYLSEEPVTYDSDEDIENSDLVENESDRMKPHCPAQDALLKVHDRIAADELLHGSKEHSDKEDDESVTTRILVPNNQVGCLLGKGGHIIQRLRGDTGANIRILPSEHLPPCAMSTDELVQISGIPSVARRALYEISTLLHQHPRKENPPLDEVIYASTQGSYPPPSASMPLAPPVPYYGGYGDESSRFGSGGLGGHIGRGEKPEEFSMRIVCPAAKIGGVIGKGGSSVKQLQQQTGAIIQVEDTSDSDERVLVVSSREVLWNPVSPTIEAVLQLQGRTSETSDKGITTRLLVPSSKVGCLLGQGGHIITEMRRRTKADIRVYSKDDKPKYASSNEELVQITGNQSVARDALSEIASRLRERVLQGGNHAEVESHVRPHSFREYAQPEGFPGRGLPLSGGGAGYTGSYEHLKGAGQKLEANSYPVTSINTGYHMYDSPEVKIARSEASSILSRDRSYISSASQVSGARPKLYDPLSAASDYAFEMHGSSAQWNPSPGFSQTYGSSAQWNPSPDFSQTYLTSSRQNLVSGGQNLPPSQGRYPY